MQKMLDCVGNRINDKLLKQSFFYTYLLGLAAHAYCFLNLTVSHDSLRAFYIAGKYPKASLGRIFYGAYIALTRGKIVLPWAIGVLGLFWISIAVYFIVRMFQMEKRVIVILVAGICVTLQLPIFMILMQMPLPYFWQWLPFFYGSRPCQFYGQRKNFHCCVLHRF